MKSKKATKRALLSSALSLVLCFSMLLGTTFAWFTDEASTGTNIIKSGTLEVKLMGYDETEGTYTDDLQGDNFQFKNQSGSPDILWEPGATFRTDGFQIQNHGDLWLKYQMVINGVTDGSYSKLLDVIDFYVTTIAPTGYTTGAEYLTAVKNYMGVESFELSDFVSEYRVLAPMGKPGSIGDPATAYDDYDGTFYLVGHMQEEAGNDYQGKTIEGVGITVYATQMEAEFDSFSNEYDEDATTNIKLTAAATPVAGSDVVLAIDHPEIPDEDIIQVTVPKENIADPEQQVKLEIKRVNETPGGLTVAADQGFHAFDISLTNVKGTVTKLYAVNLYVGPGLNEVELYHEDEAFTLRATKAEVDRAGEFYYDFSSGVIYLLTDSFSPYTVLYKQDLPVAKVTDFANKNISAKAGLTGGATEMTLDTAYQFEPTQSREVAQKSPYRYWHADFVVSADKAVPAESLALAGYYTAWCGEDGPWVALTSPADIAADTEIRLIDGMGGGSITVNYEEICNYGNDNVGFRCGAVDLTGVNAGTTLTVELRLYETEEPSESNGNSTNVETGKYVIIGKFDYTFPVKNNVGLKTVLAAGATEVELLDGEYDLNGIQKDGLTLIGVGENVKVANTTDYASSGRLGAIWKAINLENVTITNTVYTMADGGNATFTNVNFAAGVRRAYGKNVTFTNCTFGLNTEDYALHFESDPASEGGVITLTGCEFKGGKVHLGSKRAYEFTNCEFAEGTDFQVWSNITLEDCTVNGVEVTADNAASFFPKLDLGKVDFQ